MNVNLTVKVTANVVDDFKDATHILVISSNNVQGLKDNQLYERSKINPNTVIDDDYVFNSVFKMADYVPISITVK